MSYTVTIPFFAFKLHYTTGSPGLTPLHNLGLMRFSQSLEKVADSFAHDYQRFVTNKGKLKDIMDHWQSGKFIKSKVLIPIPKSKDGFSYPNIELEFDFFYKKNERGFWCVVPALRLEAFAETEQEIESNLIGVILQDFKRTRRLNSVHGIVDAIWYKEIELLQHDIEIKFPTPSELLDTQELQSDEWLPKVATKLQIEEQTTYGRAAEMNRLIRAMKGNSIRNVLLVGASGVGKTALVWELAYRRKEEEFRGQIWETSASVLIKELIQDTGWQDNIISLVKELTSKGDILFVRNLLELFEVGKYQGNNISIAEYLLPYISRGELTIISECTNEEKGIIELRSSNFLSNFQIISMEAPKDDLEDIILKKVKDLSAKNKIQIEAEAIEETIRLNKRFTPYSGFPGKPIRFLESILLNQISAKGRESMIEISRSKVIGHFCEETGMPPFMIDPIIPMSPSQIKAQFNNAVFGQESAVESVVNMLSTVKTGLSKTGKPIASFLFVGPTGVGKTELAKVLSAFMFGSRDRMTRFDMSEYSSYDAVSKLLGAGFYTDGLLTSTVRREPFCVLLFDEIEKAHPDFYDLLLQMLSEGRLTDSRRKLVNFCSTIIIMTSNIGAAAMQRRTIGPENKNQHKEISQRYLRAVQDYFKPEIYNRIDQVIPFETLSQDTVRFVVEREVESLKKREGIRYRRMDLTIEEEVLDYLSKKGYDSRYGARYLQRVLRQELIIPLSKKVNVFDLDDQLIVNISVENKRIKIIVDSDPLGLDLLFEEIEKFDYADLTGEYRRQMQKFQSGFLFTQLMSDLDILIRKKNKLGERFWEEKGRSEKYSILLNLKSEVEIQAMEMEKLETNFSLACMELEDYKTEWTEQLGKWKADFFELKVKNLMQANPMNGNGRVRIYGKNIQPLMDFYMEFFIKKGFEFSMQTVWYRDSFYNEKIELINKKGKVHSESRKEYYVRDWMDKSDENFEPEEVQDVFCGVDFLLVGKCPKLYLQNESGMQRWKMAPKEEYTYISEVVEINAPFPDNIHKKAFFESKNPFRIVEPLFLEDKNLNIKREVMKGNYLDLIIPILDDRFGLSVDLAVL
jgi:ATP-dependent Clp protease ATP-binding subunit ClpA